MRVSKTSEKNWTKAALWVALSGAFLAKFKVLSMEGARQLSFFSFIR